MNEGCCCEPSPSALGSELHFHKPSPLVLPQLLYQEWASYKVFYKYQPIDLVRYEGAPGKKERAWLLRGCGRRVPAWMSVGLDRTEYSAPGDPYGLEELEKGALGPPQLRGFTAGWALPVVFTLFS